MLNTMVVTVFLLLGTPTGTLNGVEIHYANVTNVTSVGELEVDITLSGVVRDDDTVDYMKGNPKQSVRLVGLSCLGKDISETKKWLKKNGPGVVLLVGLPRTDENGSLLAVVTPQTPRDLMDESLNCYLLKQLVCFIEPQNNTAMVYYLGCEPIKKLATSLVGRDPDDK